MFYGFDPKNILHFYFLYKWFPDSNTKRERERERERERDRERQSEKRRERVSLQRCWAQTTIPSLDVPLSSHWWDLAARSRHKARTVKIVLKRSSCQDRTVRSHREIVPPPSRSNSFRLNLSASWSLPPLDRSHRPWPTHDRSLSFSIYLSISLDLRSLSLPPPSLSFDRMVLCIENGFVLIFVSLRMVLIWEWVCFDLRMVLCIENGFVW